MVARDGCRNTPGVRVLNSLLDVFESEYVMEVYIRQEVCLYISYDKTFFLDEPQASDIRIILEKVQWGILLYLNSLAGV